MNHTVCLMCGVGVAYKTKPPKTCKGCRSAYRACLKRNREESREAARLVGEALARLRLRAPDLAGKVQRDLAAAVVKLDEPETWQPTTAQQEARKDRLWPDRHELLGQRIAPPSGSGRPGGGR